MDVDTLRVALAVVAGILLVLFYFAAYRPTGAAYSAWWTVALLFFALGSVAYLANGTAAQAELNPLGNGLAVAGAEATWCGARSLRAPRLRGLWLLVAPLVTIAAAAVDHPGTDVWAGGLVFLLLMAAMFILACRDLVLAGRSTPEASYLVLIRALASASALLAVFYIARAVVFESVGPDDQLFVNGFGTGPTTLLLIAQLVVVSFSMSSLSTQQRIDDLRQRAVYDGLTGLLRAQEFRTHAPVTLAGFRHRGQPAMLAMADLDHFKQINDDLGHAAGDAVLRVFGRSARSALGADALCGRLGGEEFALLFRAEDDAEAERLLSGLTTSFQEAVKLPDGRVPTVSFGLVPASPDVPLAELLERADHALYRAKNGGRSRIVHG